MFLRLIIVSIVYFLITVLGHYYLFLRLVVPLGTYAQWWGASLFLFLWALMFFGFPLARAVPYTIRKTVEFSMYFWMGAAYFFLLLCLLTAPLNTYLGFFRYSKAQTNLAQLVIIGGISLIIYAVYSVLKPETVIEKTIPIRDNLSKSLEDIKIVLLSDIHVAGLIGRRRMERLAKKVMKIQPDLIFVCGDLVDGSVRQLRRSIMPLKQIQARLGIYYVTGNHEYYCNPKRWKEFVSSEFGWNVLENSHAEIDVSGNAVINVIGIEDRQSLRVRAHGKKKKVDHRMEDALNGFDRSLASERLNILLAHQPKDAYLMKDHPFIDLQLSGHTHGGQFWPLDLLVKSDQSYVKGLSRTGTHQHIYVSQGTGFWGPPMRFGTQCEISVLRFTCSEKMD